MKKAGKRARPSDYTGVKAAVYARVSTKDQTCELQLRELREYCQRRGWEIAGEYVDTGWSGAKKSRPQLDRIMQDAAEHRFDCILVWKLDRWGRSVLHLSDSLRKLKGYGVSWMAVTQGLDTADGSPTAALLLNILAAVAEFERSMIQERVKAGMRAAACQGARLGRPKKVVDRLRALDMHAAGFSSREIAGTLGVGRGTIQRLLARNPSNTPPTQLTH